MIQSTDIKRTSFALILTTHRLWGKIFVPYILLKESNNQYYRLSECLSPYQSEETMKTLDDEERELVMIINEYSDKSLFKLFSREKNIRDFLESVTSERIEKNIRPYIERRLKKCFIIARDEGIICFNKTAYSNLVHIKDRIYMPDEQAKPLFRFDRNSEGIKYKLKIELGGKQIELFHNPIDILCSTPCIIRESDRILMVEDIDGLKLKPFLTKENVIIPRNSEIKYFSGFVLNAINKFKVEETGFSIIEPSPSKTACLSLEISISGSPVLILSYLYSNTRISPDDPAPYFTRFDIKAGDFTFFKYRRDFEWESRCRETLTAFGFISDDNINFNYNSNNPDPDERMRSMIEVINRYYNELMEAGFILKTKKLDRNYNFRPVIIEISNKLENDWFDLKAVIKIDKWEFPFTSFRYNIINGIREFELPDSTIAILPEVWFNWYRNISKFGNVQGDSLRVHKQHFPLLSEMPADNDPESIKHLEKLQFTDKLPYQVSPSEMNCIMRKYQVEGLNWLYWLQTSRLGGCLADDMGLGKTIQTLALLQYNKETLASKENQTPGNNELTLFQFPLPEFNSLIIVPATLIHNWENEIRRFVPEMKMYTHSGTQRTRKAALFSSYHIIISSYHTVRQDVAMLSSFKFHYIILDESQAIKNPGSLIYKSVTKLKSDFRLVLSGTPVENSLTDLWAQLNFVNPGLLGNLSFFRREYINPIDKEGDEEKECRLKKLIKPFILRRTKEMVAQDLPSLTEQTVFCDMTDEQEKIYEETKSAVRNILINRIGQEERQEKSAILVLQGLMKLRQISNHPVIADEEYTGGSGKFETILGDIENVVAERHKILVFSSFVKHLKLFASALEKKNIMFSILTGKSTGRDKIVSGFQKDSSNRVFLISLKAGGVGLNLTSADYVFILDPWWNPASEMQAMNRAHRIGQNKNVLVYRYISTGTIEEKIINLQLKKTKIAESFVRSTNPLKNLDIKEILQLIE